MEIDEKTVEATLGKLKRMTNETELRAVAEAVAAANIPEKSVNSLFLGKVLFNKELYADKADLTTIVANTERRGLYKRNLGRTPRMKIPVALKNGLDIDATDAFIDAVARTRLFCGKFKHPSFHPTMAQGVNAWKAIIAFGESLVDAGERIESAIEKALKKRRLDAGGAPLTLIPIDRYLAEAIMLKPYDINMDALKTVAMLTRENLRARKTALGGALGKTHLPVGKKFVDACLSDRWTGYSEKYFQRGMANIWDDMLTSWAFSLIGRDVDVDFQLRSIITGLTGFLDETSVIRFSQRKIAGGLTLVVRDAKRDQFGYRSAVFGVYDADVAERLAELVARNRLRLKLSNSRKLDVARTILSRDLLVQGVSITPSVPVEEMKNFAESFGTLSIG